MALKDKTTNFSTLFQELLVASCMFLLMLPYYVWELPIQLLLLIQIVPVVFFLKKNDFKNSISFHFFILFLLLMIYTSLVQGLTLAYMAFVISIAIFPFGERKFSSGVYKYLKLIYAYVSLGSLVVWALVLLGFSFPSQVIEPLNSLKPYTYTAYPLLVIPNILDVDFFMFNGPFDEHGVVGTFSWFFMYIERYNLKSFQNIIIFIAGLCSFSLAFILGSIAYFIFILFFSKSKKWLFLAILIAPLFYVVTKDIPVMQDNIYSRFEFDKDTGKISGDSRSTQEFDAYFEKIKGTSIYYFGADKTVIDRFSGSAGYRNAILKYGAIFYYLYLFLFISMAWFRTKSVKKTAFFAFMIIAMFYQRPGLNDLNYVFMLSMFMRSLEDSTVNKTRETNKVKEQCQLKLQQI